jgi:signal transduction histidine kinase
MKGTFPECSWRGMSMHETVIFVSDDSAHLAALGRQWRKMNRGGDGRGFNDGEAALDYLFSVDSAVVVATRAMHRMDGIAFINAVKDAGSRFSEKYYYVLLVADRYSGEDAAAVLDLGLADYIVEPIDLTELRARIDKGFTTVRRERALKEATQQLDDALAAMNRFVSFLNHELRTPIGAISSLVDLLSNTQLDADQRELVEMIHNNGTLTLSLLTDVLDLTVLTSGKLKITSVSVDLHQLLQEVRSIAEVPAQSKGLKFEIEINRDMPRTVIGDPVRIKQVLINLVANAVKATAHGAVRIRVDNEGQDKRGWLRISVHDTGIGMDEAKKRLFTTIKDIDAERHRIFDGSGLGLSICRYVVSLWGGEVGVSSEKGVGSTFWFTLPIEMHEIVPE